MIPLEIELGSTNGGMQHEHGASAIKSKERNGTISHACEMVPFLTLLEVGHFQVGMRAGVYNPKTEVGERVQGF